MNTIQQVHYRGIISRINYLNELLHIKSKTELIMPMEHYFENPEDLLIFIE